MSTSDTANQSASSRRRKANGSAEPVRGDGQAAKKRIGRAPAAAEQVPVRQGAGQSAPSERTESARREPVPEWDEAQWRQRVAEAAYFRAERRGFTGGSPEQDWYEAEDELRSGTKESRA